MSAAFIRSPAFQEKPGFRSMGMKLLMICGLALIMSIPALFVSGLIEDRTKRASEVTQEISAHVGGPQTFLGPTLAVPYIVQPEQSAGTAKEGMYLIFPKQASAAVRVATEERRRSLFKVPVFQADLDMKGTFDLAGVPSTLPKGADLDWSRAELVVGVSDPRGALADAFLTVNGKTITLLPAEIAPDISIGSDQNQRLKLTLFGSRLDSKGKPDTLTVSSVLHFSGAQRIAVLAFGKSTQLTAQGNWPSPGFDGGFLPVSRQISRQGFSAEWSVPFIARHVRAEGQSDSITGLEGTALGISLIEVADPYQSVNRSLKYLPLFLGLVFLAYFLFEATTGKRVHPAQYVLVGVAQIIFYLLLLSIAERIGFDFGFVAAGTATVLLLSTNAGWVFTSRLQGIRAFAVFGLLYTMIYLLLRLEDNALLIGAVSSFVAVAAVMYFTRKIDWYSTPSMSREGETELARTAPPDPA